MLTITGTLYYRAPEMFTGGGYDETVDVWAVGVTVYQLITGRTPFEAEYLSATIDSIIRGEVSFEEEVWAKFGKAAKDLASRLLKKRGERLDINEAKQHFWFTKRSTPLLDLWKSASLSAKSGDETQIPTVKYLDAEYSGVGYHPLNKLGHLRVMSRKPSNNDSDNLIEVESMGDLEVESPISSSTSKPPELGKTQS
jgi:serine/threonine protein kinase